jgi:hypothetical protein
MMAQGGFPEAAKVPHRENQGHALAQGKVGGGKVTVLINHEFAPPSIEVKAETELIQQLPVLVILGSTYSQPGEDIIVLLTGAALYLDQDPDDPLQSSRIASGHMRLLNSGRGAEAQMP